MGVSDEKFFSNYLTALNFYSDFQKFTELQTEVEFKCK